MLKKIKEYAKEAADDAVKDIVKSAVTGFIMALVAGATTVFGSFIPKEFKQDDVLFVIVALSFVFGMGVLLFWRARKWSLRLACILAITASAVGAHHYYIGAILHGLPDKTNNIVLVVLPESIQQYGFQSYLLNLESRLPKTVRGSEVNADIEYIQTPLAGQLYLDNPSASHSFLSHYIANARHILGVIELVEEPDGFVLKTSVPAVEKYSDLGLSWVDVQAHGEYTRGVSGVAGVDQYGFRVELQNTLHRIHEGFHGLSLSLGAYVSSLGVNQDDLQRYRLLPIEAVIRVPAERIDTGLFFTANMSLAAYAKLQGDTQALCHHIQQYNHYETRSSEYDFLLHLHVKSNVACLLKHNPATLETAFSQASEDEQEGILRILLKRAISSKDYDAQLMDIGIVSPSDLQDIQHIRKTCRLEKVSENISFTDQCLMSNIVDIDNMNTTLVKQVVASQLEEEHVKYFSLSGSATPNDRFVIFQRWLSIAPYLDRPICEKMMTIFMLSYQQMLQQAFQRGFAPALEQVLSEVSRMYQMAGCTGAKLGTLDIHRLLTDIELQQEVIGALDNILQFEALKSKKLGEATGELLRLIKRLEDRLFLSPLDNSLPLSKTYSVDAVGAYTKKTLLSLMGNPQPYSFLEKKSLVNSIYQAFDALDFHLTFAQLGELLDHGFKKREGEKYHQSRQFVASLHRHISQHFLDPYMAEVTGLLVYGSDLESFLEFSMQHRAQPNHVHALYLYKTLDELWNQQKPLNDVLNAIESQYPKETSSQRFLHYDLLSNIHNDNTPVAIALAKQLAERADYVPSLLYRYVLAMLEAQNNNSKKMCQQLSDTGAPKWLEYALTNHFDDVLFHLTSKRFTEKLWLPDYREDTLALHEKSEQQVQQFVFFLKRYMVAYATAEIENREHDRLSQIIQQSQQACL